MNTSLTAPLGGDVLPGASLATEFKQSFVFSKIIPFVADYALRIAVGLAVLAILWGGVLFMTSLGNPEAHEKARQIITYALIGLIVALTAFGIVQILSTLQFV